MDSYAKSNENQAMDVAGLLQKRKVITVQSINQYTGLKLRYGILKRAFSIWHKYYYK